MHLCLAAWWELPQSNSSYLRLLPVSPGSSPEFSDVSEPWELLSSWGLHRAWSSWSKATVKGFCSCWCSMGCFLPGRPEGGRIFLFISKEFKAGSFFFFFKGVELYLSWSNISNLHSHQNKSQTLSAPCSTMTTCVAALKRGDLNLW